jgi:glyoxylase-like metal-dependent hydrolase (beta-lactamase superfamily II)
MRKVHRYDWGRRYLVHALGAGLFLFIAGLAFTQNQTAPPELKVIKLHENLYEIEGDGGNVTVRVTTEGVILGDVKHERDHDAIVAAIRSVTSQPVKYIFNTHYHDDHSGGNAKFLPTAEIITTPNTRLHLLEHIRPNTRQEVPNNLPGRIVFREETSVFLGGVEVRAGYFGRGHTNGDAVIYFPDLKTVQMGDMMSGTSPGIDYNGGGSLLELPKTLEKVLAAYDFDTVIPGHGPVTNRAALVAYRDNILTLTTRAQELVRQGKSQEELARFMEKEFSWAPNSIQQIQNVPGMMTELK